MNQSPAQPTDPNASHSMIALVVWVGLNAAALVLAKSGFRPTASSEPINAMSAVLIAQILGAAFLFFELLPTWWHTGRVMALSAAALAIAVRQDQASWSALPAVWLIAAAWTVCFALQLRSSAPVRTAITAAAVLFLLGTPALSYLRLETQEFSSGLLVATNAGNPLKIVAQRNFHFPPSISFFVFPLFFGGFGVLRRAMLSHNASLAPGYPQR